MPGLWTLSWLIRQGYGRYRLRNPYIGDFKVKHRPDGWWLSHPDIRMTLGRFATENEAWDHAYAVIAALEAAK